MKNFLLLAVLSVSSLTLSSHSVKKSPAEIAKTLVFPVMGTKANVGSVWGDERDGGRRKHEGIDIFAKKGTPVLAIADGVVQLRDDQLGGKTVSLHTDDQQWSVYYAHLDKQTVSEGQYVKKGQQIGTVGNTGNAKSTPAHLHFGIYTNNGAIDPLPYVKSSPRLSSPVAADKEETTVSRKRVEETSSSSRRTKRNSGTAKTEAGRVIGTAAKGVATQILRDQILKRIKF